MTNFGATFKKARESKGIPLAKIADETRISSRFLEAIEKEEFHRLPGGIFNRGFIRTYAERVGLDPERALSEYEQLLLNTSEPDQPTFMVEAPVPQRQKHYYPLAIGALALLIVIFYIVTRESGSTAETATTTQPSVVSSEPTIPEVPTLPSATTSVSAAPEPEPPAPAPASALNLDVEVQEQTWIRVVVDNGQSPGELLDPGMTRHFTAQNSMSVTLGNAGGITMKLNDKPLKSLGTSGKVREFLITPATLKDFIK